MKASFIRQRGFSLLECVSALSIGIMVLFMVMAFYIHERNMASRIQALSRLENCAQFASYLLNRYISKAGLIASYPVKQSFEALNVNVDKKFFIRSENGFLIKQNELTIQTMSPKTELLKTKLDHDNKMVVGINANFKAGDDVVIADCHHAAFVHLDRVSISPKNHEKILFSAVPILSAFEINSEVGVWHFIRFFVDKKTHVLYMMEHDKPKIPLTSGVLKIDFHEMKLHADTVGIKVDLLLQSDMNSQDHKNFSFMVPLQSRELQSGEYVIPAPISHPRADPSSPRRSVIPAPIRHPRVGGDLLYGV